MSSVDYTPSSLAAFLKSAESLSAEEFRRWMQSPNLELLGVVYDAISSAAILVKISPPLSEECAQQFLRCYFQRCIIENEQGEWFDSRYSACWDCANWLRAKWRALSGEQRSEWKVWLATLYTKGDSSLRLAMETGLLEHLLSDKEIAKCFRHWRDDETLGEAYRLSLAVAGGARSIDADKRS